jgi:uncharacterized protein (DUF1697 family)
VIDRRVALLRGINVGAAKRIAMADLRKLLEDLGYGDVRTLLNSGNIVFTVVKKSAVDDGVRIEKAIADRLGVTTRVTVLPGREVAKAVDENPLRAIADNPSRLLFMAFRDSKGAAQLKPLLEERWAPEALALGSRVAYFWCPNGITESRLLVAANRIIGEAGTARNLTTMTKLLALIRE